MVTVLIQQGDRAGERAHDARGPRHPARREDTTNLCSVVIRPRGADRSPCGTGTSARTATLGAFPAVRNRITGTAYLTGTAEWSVDPADPLRHGFLVLG